MNKLEELEFDEWAIVYMGDTQYELNIFPNEHGELCVTVYPMKMTMKKTASGGTEVQAQVDTLNPVAGGSLDIFSPKRIKEGI
tara:strand:- start:274 stop:522 length:249 start_codon:yes stop_codon:yes gene_type:complete